MALNQGFDVTVIGDPIEDAARTVAKHHARLAIEAQNRMARDDAPNLLLSGGELTVTRTGHGIIGPNAEDVLALALELNGRDEIHAIACDTDGVDGAADVAGAIMGPDMLTRGGYHAAASALENNDAHNFFERLGAQVVTGPTLTQVNDFRAILIEAR